MSLKKNSKLNIYLNGTLLGHLEFINKSRLIFSYAESWLNKENNFPISRGLPLRELPYDNDTVLNYFDNLLPDDISIRQKLAANSLADSDSVFDLLVALGKDCVGALQFIPFQQAPPVLKKPSGIIISNTEIANKIKSLTLMPLALDFKSDFRLSLAGAQEKAAFLKIKNTWLIPTGATPTTHIFKPQMTHHHADFIFKNSIENEWLCSQILKGFNIPTAQSDICTFNDTTVLVVERFDRVQKNQLILRIPQEDLCQALKIPSFKKYQSQGGPSISSIMNLLFESTHQDDDRKNFIKTQIIFYFLAAIDGHGKNFSLRWGPSGFRMTPLYDVLSADPLIHIKNFQFKKIKMAMAVGDNNHYKLSELLPLHFLQTAKKCRISEKDFKKIVDELLTQVNTAINFAEKNIPKKFPEYIADSIFKGLKKRSENFILSSEIFS